MQNASRGIDTCQNSQVSQPVWLIRRIDFIQTRGVQ
jgi:hypothetical protein